MPSSRRTPRRRKHPRADMESAPTANSKRRSQPGNRELYVITNPCRGRCSHRPGNPAAPEGPREGHGPPLQTFRNVPPNRNGCDHPGVRRAGCPHPAAPRGAANVRGRIWNPPLRPTANAAVNRETAPPQGPAGGPWPSPTNHDGAAITIQAAISPPFTSHPPKFLIPHS